MTQGAVSNATLGLVTNGSAATFPFNFTVLRKEDLRVYFTPSGGARVLISEFDYNVNFNSNDPQQVTGGDIVFVLSPAPGVLDIVRETTQDQERVFAKGAAVPGEQVEQGLDKLTRMIWDTNSKINNEALSLFNPTGEIDTTITGELEDNSVPFFNLSLQKFVWKVPAGDTTTVVSSFNGRPGDVLPQTADYETSQVIESPNRSFLLDVERSKLAGIEDGATADQTGAEIKSAYEGEANTNGFTDAEKNKLAGLTDPLWLGTYVTLLALTSAHPDPQDGSSAHVDGGVGQVAVLYIWDADDDAWVQAGGEGSDTAATVKLKYESNPDTNAFLDSEKSKLASVEQRATHTGTQLASTISDFSAAVNTNGAVSANTAKVSFPEAPVDSTPYAREDGGWVSIPEYPLAKPIIATKGYVTATYLPGTKLEPLVPLIVQGAGTSYDGVNRRFIVGEAGIYRISFSAIVLATNTRVSVGHNNDAPSTAQEIGAIYSGGSTQELHSTTFIVNLAASDYIVFYVQTGSVIDDVNKNGNVAIERIA